ncbi:shugoshin 1 [Discoglossus pictus]
MAKERCQKKAFQDSLEGIKERMKEKRTKKLAMVKVAPANKALSTKVIMINNNSAAMENIQANNKALALALQAEKSKTRQAQDIILHLKNEHQKLMFEIFLLRRKLTLQQGQNPSEARLASLKEIISKVTENLLETANLLGPAHALCSNESPNVSSSGLDERNDANDSGKTCLMTLPQRVPVSNADTMLKSCSDADMNLEEDILVGSKNNLNENKLPKGRRSISYQPCFTSNLETPNTEERITSGNSCFRNVSTRRRHSNLNGCSKVPDEVESLQDDCSNSGLGIPEQENRVFMEECSNKSLTDEAIENIPFPPSKESFLPPENISEIATSTPEPKQKKMANNNKEDLVAGRETGRKSRADRAVVQLKKTWENSKSRARSKSRERGASKQIKEKMEVSLNSGDAYDFVFEESVHVTPFRQNKQEESPDKKMSEEKSMDDSNMNGSINESISEDDLDDLYVPYSKKSKSKTPVPSRPRYKRGVVHQQQTLVKECKKKENTKQANHKKSAKNNLRAKPENVLERSNTAETEMVEQSLLVCANMEEEIGEDVETRATLDGVDCTNIDPKEIIIGDFATPTSRFRLSDVTNLSGCSGNTSMKKHSYSLFPEDERKKHGTPIRKRRCTVPVNYAEPTLKRKLRRGDPFTNTEFLRSPIFKEEKRSSLKKKSLTRYNEAFVGCR